MHITDRVKQLKQKAAQLANMNPLLAAGHAKALLTETTDFLEQVTRHVTDLNDQQKQTADELQQLKAKLGGLIGQ